MDVREGCHFFDWEKGGCWVVGFLELVLSSPVYIQRWQAGFAAQSRVLRLRYFSRRLKSLPRSKTLHLLSSEGEKRR